MTDLPESQTHKAPKMSPPELVPRFTQSGASINPTNPTQTSPLSLQTTKNVQADDDEQLFAQMRQVREAMSESISWFRAEREKSERSHSESSRSRDIPNPHPVNETEKQRRLREWKPTPSRTEIRLRATGGGGLLPKGWVAANVEDEEKKDAEGEMGQDTPRGFAAIESGFGETWGRGNEGGGSRGTGASADDAIEL